MHKSHCAWLYFLNRMQQIACCDVAIQTKQKEEMKNHKRDQNRRKKMLWKRLGERRQSGNIISEVCTAKLLINDIIEMGYLIHTVHRDGRLGAQSYSDIYETQIIDRNPDQRKKNISNHI